MTSKIDLSNSVAFSYARFSDTQQAKGHSLQRQHDYAPQFCAEYGCKLNTTLEFSDEGRSAFHGKHVKKGGQLARFFECVEAGLIKDGDILIIENLDRFSRLPIDQAQDLLKSVLSKGVRLHVRSPWAIYDRSTLRDPMQWMSCIFEFTRSNRESAYKQERLGRRWLRNRELARNKDYLIALTPGWLRPIRSKGKVTAFETIPERVATVKQIFQLCVDGHGMFSICKILNDQGKPTFGKASLWGRSSVARILKNRSVLGEYQPHTKISIDGNKVESTKRVPVGDTIEGYFPAIIDEKTFNDAQLSLQSRSEKRSGAGALKVVNLFSGLLLDARDGSTVSVCDKGTGPQLVSNRDVHTVGGAAYTPYRLLEDSFALFVDEMPLELVAPKNQKVLNKSIAALKKEIQSLELQVEKIREKTRTRTSDALLDLLIDRDTELKEKRREIETLERSRGDSASVAAKTSKSLLQAIRSADPDELVSIRTKLRSEISYWIKTIYLLPVRLGASRAMMATVELKNGATFELRATDELIDWPTELDGLLAKDFKHWPSDARKTQWAIESDFDKKVRQMHAEGATFAEMATALSSSVSVVSKRSLSMGLRKTATRKKLSKTRLMNWHTGGNGWSRTHGGKRHFIGCRNLQKLYPRLVTTLDEAGTERAATRYWLDNFSE